MLKKLFYYEWKDCWKMLSLLNGVVLVLTVIGVITFQNDIWSKADESEIVAMTLFGYMIFYVIAVMALSMVSGLYFWYRFYKNLYTDQGYLMFTLPVNAHQIIWSKAFVAMIWYFICMVVMMVSVVSMVASAASGAGAANVFAEIAELFREIFEIEGGGLILILMAICAVVSTIMAILLGYASVSIGQLFKKHRLGAAVGVYVALNMAIQMISSYASIPLSTFMIKIENEQEGMMSMCIVFAFMIVVISAVSVGLYFITHYIMEHKLNLE